jgi:hypothetical protein
MPDIPAEIWFPVLTLLLGFVAKAVSDAVAHRRTIGREREARQHERRHQVQERRTAFQRDTLLQLQDAVGELMRTTAIMQLADHDRYRETGQWGKQLYDEQLSERNRVANAETSKLGARVHDDVIRDLLARVKAISAQIPLAPSPDQAHRALTQSFAAAEALNERIGVVFRALDSE